MRGIDGEEQEDVKGEEVGGGGRVEVNSASQ